MRPGKRRLAVDRRCFLLGADFRGRGKRHRLYPDQRRHHRLLWRFRPGDNLYGTSLIALDAGTGERVWHFQMVKHDIWNYDNPMAPVLLDLNVDGQGPIRLSCKVTKQSYVYAFNRLTGEPIWPMEEREVPQSIVPGEVLSPTQLFPTRPAPFDMQGVSIDDLVDWTPELRQQAIEAMANYEMGPLFNPPIHRDNPLGKRASLICPGGGGGANITSPAVADPGTGILYISSQSRLQSGPARARRRSGPAIRGAYRHHVLAIC